MRVWLYYRLSRDEDEELNSLNNQRKIIFDYATDKGFDVVGESCDDNISGMHFNREGIDKIYDAVENDLIDAVLVKDLSRLGRHRTQTAMFIDFLRSNNVRVLSVTENIDTANENDDLIVGFKGIVNDFYAKDISRKVRAGFRQKQKDGLIMTAPFGYFKDKNTGQVVVVEDAADTVRMIFSLYAGGYGLKSIARILNEKSCDTPATVQERMLGKQRACTWTQMTHRNIWVNTQVKRILRDEIYTGTLINHKTDESSIHKTFRFTAPEEQFRHDNFVPALITRELWEQAQFLLSERKKNNIRASANKPIHRYAGLLKCKDCGAVFTGKRRYWRDKPERIEYTCNSYHRYGKEHCSSHRIDEAVIDKLIYDELLFIKHQAQDNWSAIEDVVREWSSRKSEIERHITRLGDKIASLEADIEGILMERIRDKANAERYDRMLVKRETDIANAREQIERYRDINATVQKKRTEMRHSIDLLDDIISNDGISEAHLRMIIDKVLIAEVDGQLQLEFCLKAAFRKHFDAYDELGNLVDSGVEFGVGDVRGDDEDEDDDIA